MSEVIGIIHSYDEQERLYKLTQSSCTASIPFAGKYRLVDFVLSNMVNSDISNITMFVNHKSRSLIDHLGNGKGWGLDRNPGGLSIQPHYAWSDSQGPLRGDIPNLYSLLEYLTQCKEKYVIIAPSHVVCNLNFKKMIDCHIALNSDVTVLFAHASDCHAGEFDKSRKLEMNQRRRVTGFFHDHGISPNPGHKNIFMEIFIMNRSLLLEMINASYLSKSNHYLIDAIFRKSGELNIQGFLYQGYLAIMDSIENYFSHSMNILRPNVWKQLFVGEEPIYTQVAEENPTIPQEQAKVHNSLVGQGCTIEGYVENSVIFSGVKVNKDAYIKNCVIMHNCEIEADTYLENVILDKQTFIEQGRNLRAQSNHPVFE